MVQETVPVIVVPGFYGYVARTDELSPDVSPAGLLVDLWLSLLEGREDHPVSYEVAAPSEGVLCKELPPDPGIDGLASALPEHVDGGRLSCFAYDWRQDLTASAARLAGEIAEKAATEGTRELDLIGIGPGGLVARYLVESGTLAHAASLVRRLVLIGTPHWGVPAGLLLLHGLLRVFAPRLALEETLASFPAGIQLIPPRGVSYLYLLDHPGVCIEPYAWPESFFGGGETGEVVPPEVTREVVRCNEALHGGLKDGFDPSWRRSLVFASASEATYHDLQVDMEDGAVQWSRACRTAGAGDGVVPVISALPHPSTRSFLVSGSHSKLIGDNGLCERLRAFLLGPLS